MLESSQTNVHIVNEDWMRAFYLMRASCFQEMSEKTLCSKISTGNMRDIYI